MGNKAASSAAVQNVYWKFYPDLEQKLGSDSAFIKIVTQTYQSQLKAALDNYINSKSQDTSQLDGLYKDASDNGWIYAGAFYYMLAKENSSNVDSSLPAFSWAGNVNESPMKGYRNNYNAAQYLGLAASGSFNASQSSVAGDQASDLKNQVIDSLKQNFSNTLTSEGNPLILIQAFGKTMLVLAQVIFTVVLALLFATGIGGNISAWILGTGFVNPVGPATLTVSMLIMPVLLAGLSLLVTIGALLSIYTPLIPYIYFLFGAIGWLISTVETMVAGPLVALGIISPSGHEVMGKAEHAIMPLFNVFLRPSLMIFGLIAAMLLASVVVTMIGQTFKYVFLGNLVWIDPLSLCIVLVAYVGIILAALNKCFAVINLVPQQVMRWIGGQGEGVETPLHEVKGSMDAAAGQLGGAAGTGTKTAATATRQVADEKNKKSDTTIGPGDK